MIYICSMIKYIFFDFNGTIIDDVDLCLELLNKLLKSQNKPTFDIDGYKKIFTFPIIKYYEAAGIDFSIESFESLAIKFINEYQPRSLECGLYPGIKDTIKYFKDKGIKTYILSASEKNNLKEQCKHYNIVDIFDDILGIDNIHASSKMSIALDYVKKNNINTNEAIFIGDTLHDYEVGKGLGMKCFLVCCGHQSKSVLQSANVPILETINDLRRIIDNENNF